MRSELPRPARTVGRKLWLTVRLVALTGAILWGVASTGYGVHQQRVGLAPGAIDCSYRADLLRDRIVAVLEQPHLRAPDADTTVLATLLRETLAACAATAPPDVRHRLERLSALYLEATATRSRLDAIRQELFAHE